MTDATRHRKPLLLRAAAVFAWALQGIITPWIQTPAYAANPDTLTIGMRPSSPNSPAAIADLLASPTPGVPGEISLTWTAPQGNAGGTPINNLTVGKYSLHYATFSVNSLGGSTTSWWNATMVSSTTLQPPGYTPQSPGSLEAHTYTGLTVNTTYYFAARSESPFGVLSPIDVLADTPGSQAHAFSASSGSTTTISPPTGFAGAATSTGSIGWTWNTVPGATAYSIYTHPANVLLQTITAPTLTWSETGLAINTSYTRKVRATDGVATSSDSATAAVYTRAATPTTLAITGITASSIGLSWNINGNPAGTPFGLERSLDGVAFVSLTTTTASTFNDTGLTLGTTYFYRVRAVNGAGLLTPYTAIVSGTPSTSNIPPMSPNGVLSTSISNGLQVVLSWSPVTRDTSGGATAIDHYNVLRYTQIDSTATASFTIPGSASSYTDATGGTLYYYRVQAVSSLGAGSALSDNLDSAGNRYALAADDVNTRVVMPHDAAQYLLAANNAYGQDLEIVLTHQPQDEVNVTLRSYKVYAQIPSSGQILNPFAFPQNNISVELGYGSALSAGRLPAQSFGARAAGSIAQIISVYWYNGASYVSVGSPTLTGGQSIAVTVRNLGIYQIRAVVLGTKFKMAQGSPYPRVITPNGAENRRVFFFFDNPAEEQITGQIYDIRGAKVRTLAVNSMSPTPNSLVWDGRDSQGAVVPSGVYLYKISTSDQSVTGTVVVAR
jgi:hypothetical protein